MDENERIDSLVAQWTEQRPDIDRETMALLARLVRAGELANARTDHLAADYGVNRGDGDVVFALRRAGEPFRLSPTQLSRALLMTTGTMTGRLDRLEKRGLIVRVPSTHDRRSLDVELTPEGRRLADEAVTRHAAAQQEAVSVLSQRDRSDLDRVTRVLIAHLAED